jgi:tetratricopeptide (TPR) repeat protein
MRCIIQSQTSTLPYSYFITSGPNAYTAVNKVCWFVPFEKNQQFVGRDSHLDRLEKSLFDEHQPRKIAITGLGGIGKTQIVLELAFRTKDKHQDCSVFWVPATNADSLQQAFASIGEQLEVPGIKKEQADAKELVQRHLSQESAGRWLFIVDNVDDMNMWNKELKAYLPKSPRGCVVCTTRSREVAVKIAAANVIEVPELDEAMAMQLLGKSLIHQELLASHDDARKLLKQLAFLPLAIVQAAAYINRKGIVLLDYLSLLEEQEQDVVDLLSEDFEDDGNYGNIKHPVATTWLISFGHIQRLDPLAAEYLAFMSCVDPKDIPQSLLPPAPSRKKETDAIGTLNAYSFVSKRTANRALNMHRLVHLAMRNWLRQENSLTVWATKAMRRLGEVFPNDDHRNRNEWRPYLAHVRFVLERGDEKDDEIARMDLAWKFAMCLYSDGRYNEAEAPYLEVTETRRRVLGEEHENTLTSMTQLASTYWKQGLWKKAEELEVKVVEIRKRLHGEEHLETLTSIANLASTYRDKGQWKKAEEMEVKVMETRKMFLGERHQDTLTSMSNLASTYWEQGRWEEAEGLFVPVMEARQRLLGEKHPSTLISMTNLGSTYRKQERWIEAEKLELQVMETKKRVLGQEHPSTLTSVGNLAATYRKQGRWKEAEKLYVKVLEKSKRVLGKQHPSTLENMANMAFTIKDQGRIHEAILELKLCHQLGVQVFGPQHPNMLSILQLLDTWQKENLENRV